MLLGRCGEVLLSDFGIALVAQSSCYQNTQDMARRQPSQGHASMLRPRSRGIVGARVVVWSGVGPCGRPGGGGIGPIATGLHHGRPQGSPPFPTPPTPLRTFRANIVQSAFTDTPRESQLLRPHARRRAGKPLRAGLSPVPRPCVARHGRRGS